MYILKLMPLILVAYMVTVATLSFISLSMPNDTQLPEYFDKIVHFCFYFGMSILICANICIKSNAIKYWNCVWALFVTLLFGILIEVIQPYTGRSFDVTDIFANFCGDIVGIIIFVLFELRFRFFRS
ncbi:MAG: VanZ family protein [Rikenellaceae bacterium]